MELDAVDRAPDAERLDCRPVACRQVNGAWRQGEGVDVPMEDRRTLVEDCDHRVAAPGRGRPHLVPAELDRPAEDAPCAVTARHQLCAEADAEHRLVGLAIGARKRGDLGQPRALLVVKRALAAAEHDQRIVVVAILGYLLAGKGTAKLHAGAGFVQSGPDLAERRTREILDHQDAHDPAE
jgi:hypothetical protein